MPINNRKRNLNLADVAPSRQTVPWNQENLPATIPFRSAAGETGDVVQIPSRNLLFERTPDVRGDYLRALPLQVRGRELPPGAGSLSRDAQPVRENLLSDLRLSPRAIPEGGEVPPRGIHTIRGLKQSWARPELGVEFNYPTTHEQGVGILDYAKQGLQTPAQVAQLKDLAKAGVLGVKEKTTQYDVALKAFNEQGNLGAFQGALIQSGLATGTPGESDFEITNPLLKRLYAGSLAAAKKDPTGTAKKFLASAGEIAELAAYGSPGKIAQAISNYNTWARGPEGLAQKATPLTDEQISGMGVPRRDFNEELKRLKWISRFSLMAPGATSATVNRTASRPDSSLFAVPGAEGAVTPMVQKMALSEASPLAPTPTPREEQTTPSLNTISPTRVDRSQYGWLGKTEKPPSYWERNIQPNLTKAWTGFRAQQAQKAETLRKAREDYLRKLKESRMGGE